MRLFCDLEMEVLKTVSQVTFFLLPFLWNFRKKCSPFETFLGNEIFSAFVAKFATGRILSQSSFRDKNYSFSSVVR